MTRCIAFLRAVNVGGRFIKMAALRAEFEALGLANVQTFIASGNVIFDTRARDLVALERKIEAHLNASFGFGIHTFIRTEKELAAIVAHAAFDAAEAAAANTHVVGFIASAPDAATPARRSARPVFRAPLLRSPSLGTKRPCMPARPRAHQKPPGRCSTPKPAAGRFVPARGLHRSALSLPMRARNPIPSARSSAWRIA